MGFKFPERDIGICRAIIIPKGKRVGDTDFFYE